MKMAALKIGSLFYFVTIAIFIAFFVLYFIDIISVQETDAAFIALMVLTIFSSLLTLPIFVIRCPHCNNYIFRPPWKRNKEESISPKIMYGILTGRGVECMSCKKVVKNRL